MDENLPPQYPLPPTSEPNPVPTPAPEPVSAPVSPAPTPTTPAPPEPVSPAQKPPSAPYRQVWFWGLLLTVINLVAIFWFLIYPRLGAKIVIADQRITDSIYVDQVVTTVPAALALSLPGTAGEATIQFASTGILPPNSYEDFTLSFARFLEVYAGDPLEDFRVGSIIVASLYLDTDGDGTYNADIDTEPAKDLFGKPITITFRVI